MRTKEQISDRIVSLREEIDDYSDRLIEADTTHSKLAICNLISHNEIEITVLEWILEDD